VDATLPHLPPVPRAAVELIRLTGCRPGELLGMRRCDLSTTGGEFVEPLPGLRVAAQKVGRLTVWLFVPASHKGTRKEKPRVIAFGRAAQKVLRPLLKGLSGENAVFSPDRSEAQRSADRRKRRKSKVYESQERYRRDRQPDEPGRPPGETYEVCALAKAVRRACLAAGVPPWSPYQLRHRFAVDLADASDDATAAVGLGHAEGSTATARYTRAQVARLVELAAKRG
jgi:integrase